MNQFLSIVLVNLAACSFTIIHASDNNFTRGARDAGLGHSAVAIPGLESVYYNPAGIAGISLTCIALDYQNRYMLPELGTASLAIGIPVFTGSFCAAMSYFGTATYNRQKIAAGYAHKFGPKMKAGIMVDYYSDNLPGEFETAHTIAGEIGLMAQPHEKLSVGVHLNNITSSVYTNYADEKLPVLFSTGAAWQDQKFLFSSEVALSSTSRACVSLGTEITPGKNLVIRMGISNGDYLRYCFGLGYNLQGISFNLAFERHPVLGFSSFFTLQLNFSKGKN